MWAAALWLLLATAAAAQDKRAEIAPAPFVVGSRYGRSPPRVITPRNDRFFMGSRYGKRSPPPHPALPPAPPAAIHCAYTGVAQLYRCGPVVDPAPTRYHTRKSDEDPYEEED
ncbi:RYamide neuropeptides [Plutella xylostella]|uniref:RYamide neuropeptides n=1 Tax=Plutella xylostella TaxID=51655 RepID=UPI0020331847|nr:RYamide neuropeptides [Plutella xylostella]